MIKNRKGATLSELCVVLAVIAVISSTVVSFCVMIHRRSYISSQRLAAMQELEQCENTAEAWIESLSSLGAEFDLDPESHLPVAIIGSDSYSFTFIDGLISGKAPDGLEFSLQTKMISSLSFSMQSKETDTLFVCSLEYVVPKGMSKETLDYSFCINPFVGDKLVRLGASS